jgi:hypothetical protein
MAEGLAVVFLPCFLIVQPGGPNGQMRKRLTEINLRVSPGIHPETIESDYTGMLPSVEKSGKVLESLQGFFFQPDVFPLEILSVQLAIPGYPKDQLVRIYLVLHSIRYERMFMLLPDI